MNDLPAHSIYSASGAHRWTVCPGSVAAQAAIPIKPSTPYAEEGTALHEVAAICLQQDQDAVEFVDRVVRGIEITEDHATAVQLYLDTIRHDKTETSGKLLIEHKFHIKELHPQFFGTADCVRWGKDDILSVYDAKFGKGEIVEVQRPDGRPNIQLGFYALGALHELQDVSWTDFDKIQTVELVVIQPRAWHQDGPVRRVMFPFEAIVEIGEELLAAVWECEKPNPALRAGTHCRFCLAAGNCPEFRRAALATANLDFSDDVHMDITGTSPAPASLTPKQLANVLYAAAELETWITAVRAHAHRIIENGTTIPGWKLVAKQGRRKWADEEAAAFDLMYGFGLGETDIYERKLKSPAQAEKLLSKADRASKEFIDLCPSVSTGLTLVQSTNPRPEIVPSQVAYNDGTATEEGTEW
jgi:hypothetical protein